ncbi:MAG: M1 family metallopeptidase [Clostridiales bacterium]|nr:M1 family metallopeptidase [Clostridiales bacterium]
MKKCMRATAMILVSAMLLGMASCSKEKEETTKKKKKTKKTTETTETTETTDEPTFYPTTDMSDEPTDTTGAPTDTTPGPVGTTGTNGLLIDVPEAGCAIEIPSEERFFYTMDLTMDAEARTIGGHVDFEFFNTSDEDWDQLCFRDYPSLFIENKNVGAKNGTTLNGALTEIENITDGRDQSTLEYTRDEDVSVVWVPLQTKLAPGEKMTISYDFVATIPTIADRFGVKDDVYNVTNFYPILAVYTEEGWSHEAYYNMGECFFSELSDYDVTLTVPENFMVLSTGTTVSEEQKDGKKICKLDGPCVRDFVFSCSPNFKLIEGDYEGVHINVVYDEAHPASSTMDDCQAACLKAAQDSLAALGSALGKYPYEEVDIVLAPIDAGGMEYPNLVIITVDSLYCSTNSYQTIPYQLISGVIAHELGHQWFMGIVGSNSGLEPWLDESFASYTEIIYFSYMGADEEITYYSRDVLDLTDKTIVQALLAMDAVPINRPHYTFSNDDSYVTAAYYVGEMALYQMEEILGTEAFRGVLREYVRRNAFTNSTEARFFETLYDCVGTDNEDLNNLIAGVFQR